MCHFFIQDPKGDNHGMGNRTPETKVPFQPKVSNVL